MAKEDDILRDAVIGTEKEVFADAFDLEDLTHDETGDRSPEEMGDGLEGQHEPGEDDDEEGEEGSPEGETEQEAEAAHEATETAEQAEARKQAETRQETQGRVPPGRLREEAEARRAAEAERDTLKQQLESQKADAAKAISELNAKFDGMLAALKQGQQPTQKAEPPKPETPPDLFENPQAFAEYINRQADARIAAFERQQREFYVNTSMEAAKERHGETFDAAFKALTGLDRNNADNRAFVQRITSMPNPGEAVVAWHKRNEALRRIGNDPDAYERQIADKQREALMKDPEFRKQLLADLRIDASTGDNGSPRNTVRLPPSLGRTNGSNSRAPNDLDAFDGSPNAIFSSAFD